jgi:hypothetical protein
MLSNNQKDVLDDISLNDISMYLEKRNKEENLQQQKIRVENIIKELKNYYPEREIHSYFNVKLVNSEHKPQCRLYIDLPQDFESDLDKVMIVANCGHLEGHRNPYLTYGLYKKDQVIVN